MNSRIELFLFGKGVWWVCRHLLFWIFMYLDEILYTFLEQDGLQNLELFFLPFLLDVIIVYINLYYLIPKFLNQKKFITYFLLTTFTVLFNIILMLAFIYIPKGVMPYWGEFVSSFLSTITLLATAIAIKVGKFSFQQLKLTEELKFEQSKLELNYLKKQINPHFLFNVLNTIHIQSISNPSAVSETVHQLSDLLRYQIYEAGSSETVMLDKEIDFLKNYISLEELRRADLTVNWSEPNNIPRVRITPFLFLPLIENSLKHSRSINENDAIINIEWIYHPGFIELSVDNTIGDAIDKNKGGFGVNNLKKRLHFLYPGKHKLTMGINNGTFNASLQLAIDESNNY